MKTLWYELKHATRSLLKSPGFTLVAALTLALGIGANTAVFSVVNAVLLEPLPYGQEERLVRLWSAQPEQGIDRGSVSPMDLDDWREQSRTVEEIGGYSSVPTGGLDLATGPVPVELETSYVTTGFFAAFAVPAQYGRTLEPADHVDGRNRQAVLSHGAWQRHFAGDAAVVGRTVTLSGEPYTIVGVMPAGFEFPDGGIDAWVPTSVIPPSGIPRERSVRWLGVVGRLADGATVEQADAELATIAQRLEAAYPEANDGLSAVTVQPLREVLVGPIRPALVAVFAGVALLLLIACANVANISLARAETRARDLAVQAALGASRRRIAGHLVTESLLLGLAGGSLGLVLGAWGVDLLIAIAPPDLPRLRAVSLDAGVLLFTLAACVTAGLLAGLAPASRIRRLDLVSDLKEGGARAGPEGRRNIRDLVLIGQIGVVVLLAIGGSLLLRSYERLLDVEPGFDPEGVLTLGVHPAGDDYEEFLYQALDRIRDLPGVEAAGMVRPLPLGPETFEGESLGFTIAGKELPPRGELLSANLRFVSPGYFRAMGIPLHGGRDFTENDDQTLLEGPDARAVLVISRTAAERYWPGENPVGSRVRVGEAEAEVVGVVGDVRQTALADEPEPVFYVSHQQVSRRGMTIVVRGQDAAALAGPVRKAIWELRPDQPIENVASLEAVVSGSLARPRFATTLLATFAALALALAAVGVYGAIGYSVARRRREIGIRRTLGARTGQVFRTVLGHGLNIAAVGVVLGMLFAAGATRIMSSLLYGVRPLDPWSFAGASLLLLAVAACAAAIPAVRACRLDPAQVIREE